MSDCQPPASDRWWESAFGPGYLEIYAHRDDAQAGREIAALVPHLRGLPGPVLDACCGHGRHLEALRASGIPAFGFDLSRDLLEVAGRRPGCSGRLVRADARLPSFATGWGAVLLLFTAFGYFDDAANADCLGQLARLLRPGGVLLLDLPDPQQVRTALCPLSRRRLASGAEVIERRHLAGNRVIKQISYGATSWTEDVRLYARDEIAALAQGAGLRLAETWPSLAGPQAPGNRQVHWLTAPD